MNSNASPVDRSTSSSLGVPAIPFQHIFHDVGQMVAGVINIIHSAISIRADAVHVRSMRKPPSFPYVEMPSLACH